MRRWLFAFLLAFVLFAAKPVWAHRIDEYLQATILSVELGSVTLTMRLVPGVAVASSVIAEIDRNGDGVVSETEQQAYAERVLSDLLLKQDGRPLDLRVVGMSFPAIEQMRAGVGEITLTMTADLPSTKGNHTLTFENRHEGSISVYLVNALVPHDTHIQIETQNRNRNQSVYTLLFSQSIAGRATEALHWSGFAGAFHLGMRHIAEGTDHLLFLLTLLLPAPLLARGGRWTESVPVRKSLLHILGIVTAFTLGHSLTLALSAFGFVQLHSRPVEVLIAVSILVSAIHALRPIFPGREAIIAAFFGLIHGLAFASALNELGMTGGYRLVSLLAFNLGIEMMQLLVVVVTLPSFLLLSCTRWYASFRIGGSCVAAFAAIAWIVERVSGRANEVAALIQQFATHGEMLAVALFVCSLLAWFSKRVSQKSPVPVD